MHTQRVATRLVSGNVVLLAGIFGLGVASACLPSGSSTVIEFEPGGAVFAASAANDIEDARVLAIQHPREFRLLVKGYADEGTDPNPASWRPEDLALADARARALSAAILADGALECVDRVALGYALDDWRKRTPRIDGKSYGLGGGVVVMFNPEKREAPTEGAGVEHDCGVPPVR